MALQYQEHLVCSLPAAEPKQVTDALRKKYPGLKITYHELSQLAWNYDQLPDDLYKDATIIASVASLPSRPEVAPNLGTNYLRSSHIYQDPNIRFSNCSGLHGSAIAEWVVMTMLVNSHWYNMLHERQRNRDWIGEDVRTKMLREVHDNVGRRLGIMGYGSIGRQVGRVCKAMGMEIIAYTSTPRLTSESKKDKGYIVPGTGDPDGVFPDEWQSGTDKESLHKFLNSDLDYLVVTLPLTDLTRGLLGEEEFQILGKRQTFVSNVGRGEVIDTDAIVRALRLFEESNGTKGIRGAALDVTHPEPLPKDHELWSAPNVTITPHISGVFYEWLPRCFEILDKNIGRYLEGKDLANQIDKVTGYPSQTSRA